MSNGRDTLKTEINVEDVRVTHRPDECEGCFDVTLIGTRKRSSGEWGEQQRMYICYMSDLVIDELLLEIIQKYGGNYTLTRKGEDSER